MTTLENNLTQILNEKRQKIIPSNIRRGVKILNVTGTYGGEGAEVEEIEITPSAEKQVIEGSFSKVTILGDSDLTPNNIRKGVNIFGVKGELTISGDTSSYNAKLEKPVGNNHSIIYMISEIGEIDLDGITSMYSMFSNCDQLKKILGLYNTSNVKTMRQCFYNCSSLEEIPYFDTSGVTNMTNAFQNCKLITTIPELDFSSLADTYQNYGVYGMFNGCINLKSIPVIATENLEMFNSMFYGCSSLETVPELNTQKVNNVYTTFNGCSSLKDFGGFLNLGKAYTQATANYNVYVLDLSACSQLTHDSLMNVINKLYDLNLTYNVAGGGTLYTQTLKIGATNKAKLTAEEIAIATNKRLDCFIKRRKIK